MQWSRFPSKAIRDKLPKIDHKREQDEYFDPKNLEVKVNL